MVANVTAIAPATNGGKHVIEMNEPYIATVAIQGTADLLFHRWNCDAVDAKSKAAKGSKAKKTDDIESYVYRNDDGELCIPGEYLRRACVGAAKFKQDPRSPRKSAMDLFNAGLVPMTPLASLGVREWDYEHRARVQVQRNAITRMRPALKAGWRAEFEMMVNLPEYISQELLLDVIAYAGRIVGIGDFRPTYGRFALVGFGV